MKFLVVEDDERIALPLKVHLEHLEHSVRLAFDGAVGLQLALENQFDFILLDLMLPEIDGLTVCQKLRNFGCNAAIIMLTARNKTSDKITGLECGADDYLAKPFELDELTARIRAITRRGRDLRRSVLQFEDLELDQNTCLTTYRGQPVNLTPTEYRLLAHFLGNPGRTYSKDELIDRLWNGSSIISYDIIKTHIKGLRSKLAAVGAPREVIETVYGLGYKLKSHD